MICTIAFYVIFRMYKSTVEENTRQNRQTSSNLIYLLVIPGILYLAKYMYIDSKSKDTHISIPQFKAKSVSSSSSSDSLLSKTYPDELF